MGKGYFISIEGSEGAGKTTARAFMAKWFQDQGLEVVLTREPGGTPLAERMRELLLMPTEEAFHPKTEVLLVFAARNQHIEEVIKPAIKRGAIVICDRFVDSTYAYQGGGRGLGREMIDPVAHYTLEGFGPDRTFFLELDLETGLKRAAARGRLDRMEDQAIDFFERTQLAFFGQMEREPNRFIMIDASQPLEQVQAQFVPHLLDIVNHVRMRVDLKEKEHGKQ